MKRAIPILIVLMVSAISFTAVALPDLVVTGIDGIPPDAVAGTSITLLVTIENVGTTGTNGPFFVRIEVDGHDVDIIAVPGGLDRHARETLSIPWIVQVGEHVLTVVADGHEHIIESDEDNNVASVPVIGGLSEATAGALEPLKIVVTRFEDLSGSGFVNVGAGAADKLMARLVGVGLRVLERNELEALMQEHRLNPSNPSDVSTAGRMLGADILIAGAVTGVDVQETSISLGFVSHTSAAVDVTVSTRIVDVATSQILSAFSTQGHDEGSIGFSLDFGTFLSFLQSPEPSLCAGGFLTDRPWYNIGESVAFGYRNPGVGKWFGVEIYNASGTFIEWLGWEFIDTGNCDTWAWDQKNAGGLQMSPGVYSAKLWDGTSYLATLTFQIRPGVSTSLPQVDEITVGSSQFDQTLVGSALDRALDETLGILIEELERVAVDFDDRLEDTVAGEMAATLGSPGPALTGQIAAVLPDGRIAINVGASGGTARGDVFEVLEVANIITDPQTHEILDYEVLGLKGEIVVTEVRERVSYAVQTSDFEPAIGDIVRWIGH